MAVDWLIPLLCSKQNEFESLSMAVEQIANFPQDMVRNIFNYIYIYATQKVKYIYIL